MISPVLLTVRGTILPKDLETMRVMHNETAGSAPGIAAARALGDLSHKVFSPCTRAGKLNSSLPGELLFMDVWVDADGIQKFFANEQVVQQGTKLFKEREPAVWMPARGGFSFHLPAAMANQERYVGLLRAKVTSAEAAIEGFAKVMSGAIRDGRRRGQLSHELYVRLAPPNEPVEILGVDTWSSLDGLKEHYADQSHMAPIGASFAGAPTATVWEQAPGQWSEW